MVLKNDTSRVCGQTAQVYHRPVSSMIFESCFINVPNVACDFTSCSGFFHLVIVFIPYILWSAIFLGGRARCLVVISISLIYWSLSIICIIKCHLLGPRDYYFDGIWFFSSAVILFARTFSFLVSFLPQICSKSCMKPLKKRFSSFSSSTNTPRNKANESQPRQFRHPPQMQQPTCHTTPKNLASILPGSSVSAQVYEQGLHILMDALRRSDTSCRWDLQNRNLYHQQVIYSSKSATTISPQETTTDLPRTT